MSRVKRGMCKKDVKSKERNEPEEPKSKERNEQEGCQE